MDNFLIRLVLLVVIQLQAFLVSAQVTISDTIMVQNSDTIYCSSAIVPILSTNYSGLPIRYEISSGSQFVSIANAALVPLALGYCTVRAYTDGNSIYSPFSKEISFRILSSRILPVMTIANDLPVQQDDTLRLSVPSAAGVTYRWNNPQGVLNDVVAIQINSIQRSDIGMYRVDVYENTCKLASDSLLVSFPELDTKLIIYELMTPNGDGKNETFYIENLDKNPNTEVTIFNALNQVVFHSTHYENDWDGGGLPVGNYYYLVQERDCRCDAHKGILYIKM